MYQHLVRGRQNVREDLLPAIGVGLHALYMFIKLSNFLRIESQSARVDDFKAFLLDEAHDRCRLRDEEGEEVGY